MRRWIPDKDGRQDYPLTHDDFDRAFALQSALCVSLAAMILVRALMLTSGDRFINAFFGG